MSTGELWFVWLVQPSSQTHSYKRPNRRKPEKTNLIHPSNRTHKQTRHKLVLFNPIHPHIAPPTHIVLFVKLAHAEQRTQTRLRTCLSPVEHLGRRLCPTRRACSRFSPQASRLSSLLARTDLQARPLISPTRHPALSKPLIRMLFHRLDVNAFLGSRRSLVTLPSHSKPTLS